MPCREQWFIICILKCFVKMLHIYCITINFFIPLSCRRPIIQVPLDRDSKRMRTEYKLISVSINGIKREQKPFENKIFSLTGEDTGHVVWTRWGER